MSPETSSEYSSLSKLASTDLHVAVRAEYCIIVFVDPAARF